MNASEQAAEAGFSAAPIARRAAALLVDLALLCAVLAPIQFLRPALSGVERPDWLSAGLLLELFVLATLSLPAYLYFALLESGSRQATFGKRWFRIQVTDFEHRPIQKLRALVRAVVKLAPLEIAHASMLLPVPIWQAGPEASARPGFMYSTLLAGAWLVTLLLTPKSQGVHDLIAGTLVVEREAVAR